MQRFPHSSPLVATLIAASLAAGGAHAGEFKPSQGKHVAGQYIVVFDDLTYTDKAAELAANHELHLASRAHGFRIGARWNSLLRGAAIAGLNEDTARAVAKLPGVAYVLADEIGELATLQTGANDHIDLVDQRTWPGDGTYTYFYTGAGVDVFIVDNGLNISHPDVVGRASQPFDGIGTPGGGDHGLAMATLAAGTVYGVAKQATIKSVRVSGPGSAVSVLLSGLEWVNTHKTNPRSVVNISLIYQANPAIDTAVGNLVGNGFAVFVAAGNKGAGFEGVAGNACNYSPARVPGAYTVSSGTVGGRRQNWANFGPCVDLFASSYLGTSQSTALVSGVAALIWEQHPSFTAERVYEELKTRSTKNTMLDDAPPYLFDSPNRVLYSIGKATGR